MHLYLHATGRVAPAEECDTTGKKPAAEPDYTGIIPPMQLRRMSKAVRMGIAASKTCLKKAEVEKPDAIALGTAMGCLQDTELFLSKMVAQEEQLLTPTAFIQSTHNTVSGQIALQLQCHGHNLTFVHRGHSFEHAVMDAMLHLQLHPEQTLLLGGLDELTPNSELLLKMTGVNSETDAGVAAEGAAFFLSSSVPREGAWKVTALHLFKATDPVKVQEEVEMFFQEKVADARPDLVMVGDNGDAFSEAVYTPLVNGLFEGLPTCSFKLQTGEYATASAMALSMLMDGALKGIQSQNMERVIMVNHYMRHFSLWLLERHS